MISTCNYSFGSKHGHAQKLRAQMEFPSTVYHFALPDYWHDMYKEKAVILPPNKLIRGNMRLKGLMTCCQYTYINHTYHTNGGTDTDR